MMYNARMIRAAMADLIYEVRNLVQDTKGGTSQVFSDEECQNFCDRYRREIRYRPLLPLPTIAPGGSVSYTTFRYECQGRLRLEGTATFLDGGYGTVAAPSVSDYRSGQWTFGTAPIRPLMMVGAEHDVYLAAADAAEEWAAKVKLCIDVDTGDQRFTLSQQYSNLLKLADRLRGRGGVQVGRFVNVDFAVDPYA